MIINLIDNKVRDYPSDNIRCDRYVRRIHAANMTTVNTDRQVEELLSARKVQKVKRPIFLDINSAGSFHFVIASGVLMASIPAS